MLDLLLIEWVTKMKPGSNSVEDHPQLSHNGHPVDGALVGAGSLWPSYLEKILDNLLKLLPINAKFIFTCLIGYSYFKKIQKKSTGCGTLSIWIE
jgi:hypothetical protein